MKSSEFINETTCAGGMATVVGGLGSTITRNASIYGNDKPKKKKKKKGKFENSVTESASPKHRERIDIDTPETKFWITYDDRPGIRSWFLTGQLKSASQNEYVYTKDDKFTRQIPIEMVSFADYKRFRTSDEAQRALRASRFYEVSKD